MMGERIFMLAATALLGGMALAAPPPGGPPPGGPPQGGAGARPPGRPPPVVRPPVRPVHGYGPTVRLYYGGPYWWGGWGWPGAYWPYPGYFGSPAWPWYAGGYGYLPPTIVYGPPAVVTSTAGITYIERAPGTVAMQQQAPASTPAPPPPDAEPPASAPPGTPPTTGPWWYFCASPRGAYPYVRECPGGWERVPAVPPGPTR
jgi:hypothetical protein